MLQQTEYEPIIISAIYRIVYEEYFFYRKEQVF